MCSVTFIFYQDFYISTNTWRFCFITLNTKHCVILFGNHCGASPSIFCLLVSRLASTDWPKFRAKRILRALRERSACSLLPASTARAPTTMFDACWWCWTRAVVVCSITTLIVLLVKQATPVRVSDHADRIVLRVHYWNIISLWFITDQDTHTLKTQTTKLPELKTQTF